MTASTPSTVNLPILVEIAVDSWRFSRLFLKTLSKLDAGEAARYISQYKYYNDRMMQNLEATGIKLVSLEGQIYDSGMAVKVLNMEDFTPNDILHVEQMLEPIVMGEEGLIRVGTAMLGKVA